MSRNILRIDSSASGPNSTTRTLGNHLIEQIGQPGDTVVERDLASGVPFLTPEVIAYRTPEGDRATLSADALTIVEAAEQMIAELTAADVVIIGAPIYNFGVPASLKAWADLVSQAGVTFSYTPDGPVGLLIDRPTYVVTASGGVPIGSPSDLANPWLVGFLSFLGISSVETIGAEGMSIDPAAAMQRGRDAVAALAVAR